MFGAETKGRGAILIKKGVAKATSSCPLLLFVRFELLADGAGAGGVHVRALVYYQSQWRWR